MAHGSAKQSDQAREVLCAIRPNGGCQHAVAERCEPGALYLHHCQARCTTSEAVTWLRWRLSETSAGSLPRFISESAIAGALSGTLTVLVSVTWNDPAGT